MAKENSHFLQSIDAKQETADQVFWKISITGPAGEHGFAEELADYCLVDLPGYGDSDEVRLKRFRLGIEQCDVVYLVQNPAMISGSAFDSHLMENDHFQHLLALRHFGLIVTRCASIMKGEVIDESVLASKRRQLFVDMNDAFDGSLTRYQYLENKIFFVENDSEHKRYDNENLFPCLKQSILKETTDLRKLAEAEYLQQVNSVLNSWKQTVMHVENNKKVTRDDVVFELDKLSKEKVESLSMNDNWRVKVYFSSPFAGKTGNWRHQMKYMCLAQQTKEKGVRRDYRFRLDDHAVNEFSILGYFVNGISSAKIIIDVNLDLIRFLESCPDRLATVLSIDRNVLGAVLKPESPNFSPISCIKRSFAEYLEKNFNLLEKLKQNVLVPAGDGQGKRMISNMEAFTKDISNLCSSKLFYNIVIKGVNEFFMHVKQYYSSFLPSEVPREDGSETAWLEHEDLFAEFNVADLFKYEYDSNNNNTNEDSSENNNSWSRFKTIDPAIYIPLYSLSQLDALKNEGGETRLVQVQQGNSWLKILTSDHPRRVKQQSFKIIAKWPSTAVGKVMREMFHKLANTSMICNNEATFDYSMPLAQEIGDAVCSRILPDWQLITGIISLLESKCRIKFVDPELARHNFCNPRMSRNFLVMLENVFAELAVRPALDLGEAPIRSYSFTSLDELMSVASDRIGSLARQQLTDLRTAETKCRNRGGEFGYEVVYSMFLHVFFRERLGPDLFIGSELLLIDSLRRVDTVILSNNGDVYIIELKTRISGESVFHAIAQALVTKNNRAYYHIATTGKTSKNKRLFKPQDDPSKIFLVGVVCDFFNQPHFEFRKIALSTFFDLPDVQKNMFNCKKNEDVKKKIVDGKLYKIVEDALKNED